MTFGFEHYDANGNLLMSTADIGGVFVEFRTLAVGNTGSFTYNADTRFSGREIRCIQIGAGSHDWTTDTSGGYPRLNWTAKNTGRDFRSTLLIVFAQ